MEASDRAVPGAIERDLLRPEVVEEALREAVRQLELSEDEAVTRREDLEGELHRIDGELATMRKPSRQRVSLRQFWPR